MLNSRKSDGFGRSMKSYLSKQVTQKTRAAKSSSMKTLKNESVP